MVKLAKLRAVLNRRGTPNSTNLPHWYLMSDVARLPDPLPLLENLPPQGAVILRHPDAKRLKKLALRLIPPAHALNLKVLIAGDIRLALEVGADGVHLSEAFVRRGTLRIRPQNQKLFITAAAHNRAALQRAVQIGAQAILLSPVFSTKSHPGERPLGQWRFSALARHSTLPIIALGGIKTSNMSRLNHSRVHGIAAIDLWNARA